MATAREDSQIPLPYPIGEKFLNNEAYCNITLKLKDEEMKASAVVLSVNSPVFERLISELHETEIDMDDFENGGVKCFIKSFYTGKLEIIDKYIFRDVNKMAKVFKVSWLKMKCSAYFTNALADDVLDWAFDEAVFSSTVLNETLFLCEFRKYLERTQNKESFITGKLEDPQELEKNEIVALVDISHLDVSYLMKAMIQKLKKNSENIDKTSQILIDNMHLSWCYAINKSLFLDLYDCVRENLMEADFQIVKPILNKFRQVLMEKPSADILPDSPVRETKGDEWCHKLLVNIDYEAFNLTLLLDASDFKKALQENRDIKTLYMYFDCLFTWCFTNKHVPSDLDILFDLEEIKNFKMKQGWTNIDLKYLEDMAHCIGSNNLRCNDPKSFREDLITRIKCDPGMAGSEWGVTDVIQLASNYLIQNGKLIHQNQIRAADVMKCTGIFSEAEYDYEIFECSDTKTHNTTCGIAVSTVVKDNKLELYLTSKGHGVHTHCNDISVHDVHLSIYDAEKLTNPHLDSTTEKCYSLLTFLGNSPDIMSDFGKKLKKIRLNRFVFTLYISYRVK